MNDYLIYMHVKKTDKTPFYIGKGKINRAHTKKGRSKYWQNTANKYGFEVKIIENNLSEDEALKKEIYWIKEIGRADLNLGPLVNLTDGGEGFRGIHTEETKKKISLNNAKGFKGKTHSEESKKKMSYSHLNKGTKKVNKITIEGVLICSYNSIKEAAILNNTKPGMISRVCRGERNLHLGFKWYTPD